MSKGDCAAACFNNGYNCSQAVLSTFSEELGLDRNTALKIACAFGAGMGRMAKTCGAVTGAYLLIGLKYGKYREDDVTSKELTYSLVQEFTEKFISRNGSIECKELLNCDISTLDGMKFAKDNKLWDTLCTKYVIDACEIVEGILNLKTEAR